MDRYVVDPLTELILLEEEMGELRKEMVRAHDEDIKSRHEMNKIGADCACGHNEYIRSLETKEKELELKYENLERLINKRNKKKKPIL